MLKVRASLEEKLKQKGLYSSIAPKPSSALKRSRPVNGYSFALISFTLLVSNFYELISNLLFCRQLETFDDFDDDAVDVKGAAGLVNSSNKVSEYLNANLKKPKVLKLSFL